MKPPIPENLRRIEILARLINGDRLSVLDLALEYNVGEVTINRDLTSLKSQGFPVYSRKKHLYLENIPDPAILTEVLAEYLALKLNRDLLIDALRAVEAAKYPDFFQITALSAKAVEERKKLRFRYERINDGVENEYTVKPVELKLNDFNWFLLAVKEGEEIQKLFYLSRIKKISILEEDFKEIKIKNAEKKFRVELRFDASARNSLYSKIQFPKFDLTDNPDGSTTLITETPINRSVATWCLKWEDKIQVIGPPELKNKIKEMVDAFFKVNKL